MTIDDLTGKKLVVYGAGSVGMYFLRNVAGGAAEVLVIDKKLSTGQMHLGYPSCSPDEYKATEDERTNAIGVVAVFRPDDRRQIEDYFRQQGFVTVIWAFDIYETQIPPNFLAEANQGPDFYAAHGESITGARRLIEHDPLSVQVFDAFIQSHARRTYIEIPWTGVENQYFPADVPLVKGHRRMIHCGAYDGDTVRRLVGKFGKVEALACFEPDPANFSAFGNYLTSADVADCVAAFPCGVSDTESFSKLSLDNTGSFVDDGGIVDVHLVAIDHALAGFHPTIITMDIEGSELRALRGSEMVLRRDRPDLAICVYHFPQDAWEIPLWIDGLGVGYRFYLRNYTGTTQETVLYATT